jgi:hypothetical protein
MWTLLRYILPWCSNIGAIRCAVRQHGKVAVHQAAAERSKRGIVLEDGNVIVPPTRQSKGTEVRRLLAERGVDGVLVATVTGDTSIQERYAGTIFSGGYSGTSSGNAMVSAIRSRVVGYHRGR